MLIQSRRKFLRAGLQSVGALGALSRFGAMNALAAGSSYKALVCVFLHGGNDGHNTVIPVTTIRQNYTGYAGQRQGVGLALNSLLQIQNSAAETYGLHPKLTELASLYNNKKLAILSNVGMLVKPIANHQALLAGAPVPAALYSHSDQTTQWQSASPQGLLPSGWGGRMADAVLGQPSPSQFPPLINTSGQTLFCTGLNLATVAPPQGMVGLGGMSSPVRLAATQQLLTFDNGVRLVQSANDVVSKGNAHAGILMSALPGAPGLGVTFPTNNLGAQLQMVAKIIAVRQQLNASRQIFFVGHQDVTAFTTSEFGRTLMPNSSGGTDHAWGSHHFILGGAVKGGDMYGTSAARQRRSGRRQRPRRPHPRHLRRPVRRNVGPVVRRPVRCSHERRFPQPHARQLRSLHPRLHGLSSLLFWFTTPARLCLPAWSGCLFLATIISWCEAPNLTATPPVRCSATGPSSPSVRPRPSP